jgi:uncharacterized membrane protein YbaN (DUF454 family)
MVHAGRVTRWQIRDRVRRLPAGEVIVHGAVFLLGAAFIALGLVLAVLPGPLTIPPVLLGLAIWSLEFDFAQRWLAPIQRRAQQAWDAAKARPWRTGAVTCGGLVAAAAAGFALLQLDVLGALT